MSFRYIKVFSFLFAVFFVFSSFSQSLDSFLDGEMEEDIACEDLPSAFNQYTKDTSLHNQSMKSALTSAIRFLKERQNKEDWNRAEFLKSIQMFEEAYRLISDNELQLKVRSDDIGYFMKECLNSSSP